MLTFRHDAIDKESQECRLHEDTDEESQEYRLASSRTPSPSVDDDWINTPAFKWRAQQRRLRAEQEYKYSNTPLASLDSKFYKSLEEINASLDSIKFSDWRHAWHNFQEQQKKLHLFQEKEYEAMMLIIQDLQNSNNELKQEMMELKSKLKETMQENSRLESALK